MKAGYRYPAFVFSDGLKGKGRLKGKCRNGGLPFGRFRETEILCGYAAHCLWGGGLYRRQLVSGRSGMENDEAD